METPCPYMVVDKEKKCKQTRVLLGLGEYFIRKLDGTSVLGEAHLLYLIKVRFGVLGSYMNLTAGMYQSN